MDGWRETGSYHFEKYSVNLAYFPSSYLRNYYSLRELTTDSLVLSLSLSLESMCAES